ncbi:MAG: FMN-binding glutamate synthase family protein [Chloroflexota bacterium]
MRRRRSDDQFRLGLAAGALGAISLPWLARALFGAAARLGLTILTNDIFSENIWELIGAAVRAGPQVIIETGLRAAKGSVVLRPLGTPKHFAGFDGMMFTLAQLQRLPTPLGTPVATGVTIGPRARRPLKLRIPIMIAGMAYGLGLSERAKVALARGAAQVETATNTGEGPWLQAERDAAAKLVLQWNRATWAKEPSILKQVDMVEIQIGQAAYGGVGHKMAAARIGPTLRRRLGIEPGSAAVRQSRVPGVTSGADLARLIDYLRAETGGVPIGVKLSAGDDLERDIEIAVRAGADALTIDGAEGGSHGAPPVLEDDFGLPTLYALCRARRALDRLDPQHTVSLIISGGLTGPGHYLKALALGADAVAIGTIAMFAVCHSQIGKTLPFEPLTQLIWYKGKQSSRFNVEVGARDLARYLRSCTREMCVAVRALGKSSLAAVGRDDLVALDDLTAKITGLPLAWVPKSERRLVRRL